MFNAVECECAGTVRALGLNVSCHAHQTDPVLYQTGFKGGVNGLRVSTCSHDHPGKEEFGLK